MRAGRPLPWSCPAERALFRESGKGPPSPPNSTEGAGVALVAVVHWGAVAGGARTDGASAGNSEPNARRSERPMTTTDRLPGLAIWLGCAQSLEFRRCWSLTRSDRTGPLSHGARAAGPASGGPMTLAQTVVLKSIGATRAPVVSTSALPGGRSGRAHARRVVRGGEGFALT